MFLDPVAVPPIKSMVLTWLLPKKEKKKPKKEDKKEKKN